MPAASSDRRRTAACCPDEAPGDAIMVERADYKRPARAIRRAIIRPTWLSLMTHDPGLGNHRRQRAAARDLTLHASLLAILLWTAAAADLLSPGPLGRYSGVQKGNDFAQFYTMASLAVSGRFDSLEDDAKFRSAQQPYLAPGARVSYPPLYGPQLAIVLAPLSLIPYLPALALWILITIAGIAWAVRRYWRACPPLHGWWRPVLALAAAFPPFAYLVLAGQLSVLAVVSLALVVSALARGSKLLAGLALGILGYKFSLFVPALAVCVLAGEGTIALAAAALAIAQLLAVAPLVGIGVVEAFIRNTLSAARTPDAFAVTPPLMFSLRTFWSQLLPGGAATIAYAVSAVTVWAVTAHEWRRTPDPLRRVALISISIVLTAPHLFLYDLVVLIPAFVASGGILVLGRWRVLRWATTAAFLSPLATPPIAYLTGLQVAPVMLAGWLAILLSTDVQRETRSAGLR
jgi:alpha-1,2-mannosyltransferase